MPIVIPNNTNTSFNTGSPWIGFTGFGANREGAEQFVWVDLWSSITQNTSQFGQHISGSFRGNASVLNEYGQNTRITSEISVDIWDGTNLVPTKYVCHFWENESDHPGNEFIYLEETPFFRTIRVRGFHWPATQGTGINWEETYTIPNVTGTFDIPFRPPANANRDILSCTAIFEFSADFTWPSTHPFVGKNIKGDTVTMTTWLGNDYVGGDWFGGDYGPSNTSPGFTPNNLRGNSALRFFPQAKDRRNWANALPPYDPACVTDPSKVNPNLFPLGSVRINYWAMNFYHNNNFGFKAFTLTPSLYPFFDENSVTYSRITSLSRIPPISNVESGNNWSAQAIDVFRVQNPDANGFYGPDGVRFPILHDSGIPGATPTIPKPYIDTSNGSNPYDLCIDDATWHPRKFLVDFSWAISGNTPETANAKKLFTILPIQDIAYLNTCRALGFVSACPPVDAIPENIAAKIVFDSAHWPNFSGQLSNLMYYWQQKSLYNFKRFVTGDTSTNKFQYTGPFPRMILSGGTWGTAWTNSGIYEGLWSYDASEGQGGGGRDRLCDIEPALQFGIIGKSYFGYLIEYWRAHSYAIRPRYFWKITRGTGWDSTFRRDANYDELTPGTITRKNLPPTTSLEDDTSSPCYPPFAGHPNFAMPNDYSYETWGRKYITIWNANVGNNSATNTYRPQYDRMYSSVKRGLSKFGGQYSYYGLNQQAYEHDEINIVPHMFELTGDWFLKHILWAHAGSMYGFSLDNTQTNTGLAWRWTWMDIPRIIGRRYKTICESYWDGGDDANLIALNNNENAWFAGNDKSKVHPISGRYSDFRKALILWWIRCVYPEGTVIGQRDTRGHWTFFYDNDGLRVHDGNPILQRHCGYQTAFPDTTSACQGSTRLGINAGGIPVGSNDGWQQHFCLQALIFFRRLFAFHIQDQGKPIGNFYGCDILRRYDPQAALEAYGDGVFQEYFIKPTETLRSSCDVLAGLNEVGHGSSKVKGDMSITLSPQSRVQRNRVIDPSASVGNTQMVDVRNTIQVTHTYKWAGIAPDDFSLHCVLYDFLSTAQKQRYASIANALMNDALLINLPNPGSQTVLRTGQPGALPNMRLPILGSGDAIDYGMFAASWFNASLPAPNTLVINIVSGTQPYPDSSIILNRNTETVTVTLTSPGRNITDTTQELLYVGRTTPPGELVWTAMARGSYQLDSITLGSAESVTTTTSSTTGSNVSETIDVNDNTPATAAAYSRSISGGRDTIRFSEVVTTEGQSVEQIETIVLGAGEDAALGFLKRPTIPDRIAVGPEYVQALMVPSRRALESIRLSDVAGDQSVPVGPGEGGFPNFQVVFNQARLVQRPRIGCDELTALIQEAARIKRVEKNFVKEDTDITDEVTAYEEKLSVYKSVINEVIVGHSAGLNYLTQALKREFFRLESMVASPSTFYPYGVQVYQVTDETKVGDYPDVNTTFIYLSQLGISTADFAKREFGRNSSLRSFALHMPVTCLVDEFQPDISGSGIATVLLSTVEMNDPTMSYMTGSGRGWPNDSAAQDFYINDLLSPTTGVDKKIQFANILTGELISAVPYTDITTNSDGQLAVQISQGDLDLVSPGSGDTWVAKFVLDDGIELKPIFDLRYGFTAILTHTPFGISDGGLTVEDRLFVRVGGGEGTSYETMTNDQFLTQYNYSESEQARLNALSVLAEAERRFITTANLVANPLDGVAIQYSGVLRKEADKSEKRRGNFAVDQDSVFNSLERIINEFVQREYVKGRLVLRNVDRGQPFYVGGRLML